MRKYEIIIERNEISHGTITVEADSIEDAVNAVNNSDKFDNEIVGMDFENIYSEERVVQVTEHGEVNS